MNYWKHGRIYSSVDNVDVDEYDGRLRVDIRSVQLTPRKGSLNKQRYEGMLRAPSPSIVSVGLNFLLFILSFSVSMCLGLK